MSSEKPLLVENPVILKLSGRYFNKGISIQKLEKLYKTTAKRLYTFNIDLEINPEFLDCDLKDEIELYSKENEILFRGIIKECFLDEKKAIVKAQGVEAKLNYISVIGFEFSRYFSLYSGLRDLLSLLISPVEELKMGNAPDILDTILRDFIVIVPIKNLVLAEDINIGNVEFYKNFNTVDDKIIGRSNIGKKTLDWNSFTTRAKVIIKASEFRTALFEGYNEISTAIDLIALRNDLSFPRLKISEKQGSPNFQYDKFLAQVTIPTWVYCRENDTDLWVIFNIGFPINKALNLGLDEKDYFDNVNRIFSKLLSRDNRTHDEERLIMALHWLRRAIQSGDNKDKMLDLWTAMEFVISGSQADQLFGAEKIDLITQLIDSNLELLALTDNQRDALTQKIKMLNDAPLMARIEALMNKLGVNLADEEIKLIRTARSKRNKINHGEDIEIYERELNKLRSVIERLLIGKISLLGLAPDDP